jgi:outer membrane protein TolC
MNAKKEILLILFLSIYQIAFSQSHLEEYITFGLKDNLELQEKNISLEKSLIALKEAKSMFLPSMNFVANYLSADGGRVITFPAGDLFNPVYSTLNQLTASQNFPPIKNADVQLLPENFYDARLHIIYPLFNTDIYYNKTIRQEEIVLQQYEVEIYKLELVKEIKQAYYNYCATIEAVNIYKNALRIVNQNLKINQSLLNNGKGLPANVIRAESEVENISSKIVEAENIRLNAKYYFNFLLNRSLADTVEAENGPLPDSLLSGIAEIPNVANRSELHKINTGLKVYDTQLKLNRSYYLPKLSSFLDLGSQSSDFIFNSQSRYYFFGLQVDIPIYNGNRNKFKIQQIKFDIQSLELQKTFVTNQLQMVATVAQNNLKSAYAIYHSSQKQLISAKAYFKLIDKGFKEGINSLIEFIDARNQVTTAELQVNISRYKVLSQMAEYERQTANSQIK